MYAVDVKDKVIPGSDFGGEIVALGPDIHGWDIGDRVMSNFAIDHLFGDPTPELKRSHLGAPIDGVLTEYKILPAHVCLHLYDCRHSADMGASALCAFRSTSRTKKPRRCRSCYPFSAQSRSDNTVVH